MSGEGHVRVAIAHDYLTQRGGAERVVLAMAHAFPDAPIYTTLYDPEETFPEYAELDVRPSRLNRIRYLRRHHRAALPFLPSAVSSMTIDADVVLVSSSGWAHGVTSTGEKLVYCYTPARWLHQQRRYLGDHSSRGTADRPEAAQSLAAPVGRPSRPHGVGLRHGLVGRPGPRALRLRASVASSSLHPDPTPTPARPSRCRPSRPGSDGEGFELCVSRLLPYKNVDQVVAAYAAEPRRRLVVVGSGPEKDALRAAAGDNVLFLEGITDGQLAWLYRRSRALVAISYEDFGLTPLEAASFGKPSIVLRWGGFVETMVENLTAVFIEVPDAEHVRRALEQLDAREWDTDRIVEHAARFHEDVFVENIRELVKAQLEKHDRS